MFFNTASYLDKNKSRAASDMVFKFPKDDIKLEYYSKNFEYLCTNSFSCHPYTILLPKGTYLIELYGASGGSMHSITNAKRISNNQTISDSEIIKRNGNSVAKILISAAGAGAYTRGLLHLNEATKIFLHIGGMGEYSQDHHSRGGYNGGGRGMTAGAYYGGGGGGSTDLRIGKDDYWHRVMVAAGGGGADDAFDDDGSGGCGGEEEGQGMWVAGRYDDTHVAAQTSGFSFFQGEASQVNGSNNPKGYSTSNVAISDKPGAGGGWFGGFSHHDGASGAGGGSSFILHRGAVIPKGEITSHDENYENPVSMTYAFNTHSEYCFMEFEMFGGIRSGNGMARITYVGEFEKNIEITFRCRNGMAGILAIAITE